MPKKKGRMTRYKTRTRTVVRRIGSARGKFGNVLKRGLIGDTTQALGSGLLVSAVTNKVAPQATPYAALIAEYMAGGVGGMVLAEGVKSFVGMPSILGQFLQGFGLGGGQQASNGVGEVVG